MYCMRYMSKDSFRYDDDRADNDHKVDAMNC